MLYFDFATFIMMMIFDSSLLVVYYQTTKDQIYVIQL